MDNASDRLRYLYGLGGLGDASLTLTPELMRRVTSREGLQTMIRAQVTASGDPDPTNDQQWSEADASACDCALAEAQSVFQLAPDVMSTMQAACYENPASFVVALQEQAAAQGVSLDVARCGGGGVWYKDPKKLAFAVAGGAGLLAAVWLVMR